jgi:hypothetical protein
MRKLVVGLIWHVNQGAGKWNADVTGIEEIQFPHSIDLRVITADVIHADVLSIA